MSRPMKHSLTLGGHRTSVTLEDEFWQAFREIAEQQGKGINALAAEIDATQHRVGLFNSSRLDPDILTERARALLAMSQADDLVVMIDPSSGKPISGSYDELAASKLTDEIEAGID